jgi:hypothetical protein
MMQLILIILTKRKETIRTIRYCELFGSGDTTLSKIVANDLTHVSVPTTDRSIIPIMGISQQCPTAKHKQPNNLINRKEGTHKPK